MIDLKKMRSKEHCKTDISIQLYAIQLIFHSNQELDKTSSPRIKCEGEVDPTRLLKCTAFFPHLSNRNNIIAKTFREKLEFRTHTKQTERNVKDNDECVGIGRYISAYKCANYKLRNYFGQFVNKITQDDRFGWTASRKSDRERDGERCRTEFKNTNGKRRPKLKKAPQ